MCLHVNQSSGCKFRVKPCGNIWLIIIGNSGTNRYLRTMICFNPLLHAFLFHYLYCGFYEKLKKLLNMALSNMPQNNFYCCTKAALFVLIY